MGYIGAGISRFNTADELTVTGDAEFNGNINLGDNDTAVFGAGSDLQIYHSGTHSFIDDSGTGNLYIRSSDIRLQKYTGENMIVATADAGVTLYYDNNAPKLDTTASGISVTGSVVVGDSHTIGDDANDNLTLTSSTGENIKFDTAGGTTLFFESGSEVARISSGNVGIGNTAPQKLLHLQASGGATARFQSTGARVWDIGNDATTITAFVIDDVTAGQERLRIDSSGNLLVGGTNTNPQNISTTDEQLAYNVTSGFLAISRDAGPPLILNRTSSDGVILDVRRDGVAIGKMDASTAGGLSIYLGGTANANKLDDYEEGTWIPSFNLVTRTHTAQYGRYVKIGKMVHLKGYISVSSIDNTDPSGIQMTVPISANSTNSNGSRGCTFAHDAASSTLLDGSHASVQGAYVSGTTFAITNTGGGNFSYNQLTQSSGVFIFALTYEAA